MRRPMQAGRRVLNDPSRDVNGQPTRRSSGRSRRGGGTAGRRSWREEQFLRARRYVPDRLAEPLTVGGVARDMGISRGYVHRLFREYEGEDRSAKVRHSSVAAETVPPELTTAIATSMMARTIEAAGEGGGDGDGLRGSAMNASTQAALGDIMARKRPDLLAVEQEKHLPISRSVVESSERSTAVVGRRLSGKSRFRGASLLFPGLVTCIPQ